MEIDKIEMSGAFTQKYFYIEFTLYLGSEHHNITNCKSYLTLNLVKLHSFPDSDYNTMESSGYISNASYNTQQTLMSWSYIITTSW